MRLLGSRRSLIWSGSTRRRNSDVSIGSVAKAGTVADAVASLYVHAEPIDEGLIVGGVLRRGYEADWRWFSAANPADRVSGTEICTGRSPWGRSRFRYPRSQSKTKEGSRAEGMAPCCMDRENLASPIAVGVHRALPPTKLGPASQLRVQPTHGGRCGGRDGCICRAGEAQARR